MAITANRISQSSHRYRISPSKWIISNPPFHRGVDHDLDIAADFYRRAGTFLAENGRIRVVFNRHLPYTGWARQSFNRVDCLAQTREFTVIEASNTK